VGGRVLAVDPGRVRVGLALSDEGRVLASPLRTLPGEPAEELPGRIAAVVEATGAREIVVGLPRRLDGSQGPEALAARRLADEIRRLTRLPVSLFDERMTTALAERQLLSADVKRARRKQLRDQSAASVLLQGFLDRARNARG
jgi:putative pre-16S rRNA nuclease